MSYENTVCPCSGKKEPKTMLCRDCETAFADHPSMKEFKSGTDREARMHAAMTLLTLARGRITNPRTIHA